MAPLRFLATPLLLSCTLLISTVTAIGDFPCANTADSQSCAKWSVDVDRQGNISATAKCVPDPLNPSVSYCGYARAGCRKDADCDYGTCGKSGTCQGFLGDPCPNGNSDCQAFFFCGTDGLCGGQGAACANGDPTYPIPSPNLQCMSQRCVNKMCNAVRRQGVGIGGACVKNSACESGYCSETTLLCACFPTSGIQCSSTKAKRSYDSDSSDLCAQGQTACPTPFAGDLVPDCVDTSSDLENCGGCTTKGQGQDCTSIRGASSVECQSGRCVVLSCDAGLHVNLSGTGCIV
ncbi:BZ3500_MvSof-1268-A1-R1_Chr5-2g07902 [Microbotryum saponariae]|uniref:BZ3500_MvSof-1268-A1-R1_Chr5-2g07902 protein n=1 Tax=Microbotryum saponariae TaxID=289078 RepID=A0A2X0LFS0_9BASI|nr:BZ3500_MvSof-1268-A1-R1_Chr5-2g07902 [Microbotryum saponariae]SDA05771.1 BZ3501_MvSof-1269-A2-R1_Chr5-2g07724 [Microbotryum saponariae]